MKDRLSQVRERIALSAERSGRSPDDICLLTVSKKQPPSRIEEALRLGLCHFGENYLQEYRSKSRALAHTFLNSSSEPSGRLSSATQPKIHWHFIGPLQSNKVKDAVGEFEIIHSVDRKKVFDEIEKQSCRKDCVQPILLQLNLSGEESKSGFLETEVPLILEELQDCRGLQLYGLMLMPNPVADGELNRPVFAHLRSCSLLWSKYLSDPHHLSELSMGTSQDFEVAIEEGATIIRLGSLILGPRTQ